MKPSAPKKTGELVRLTLLVISRPYNSDKAEQCGQWLFDNAEAIGLLRAVKEDSEHQLKVAYARGVMLSAHKTVAQRESAARLTGQYTEALADLKAATFQFEKAMQIRKACEMCIDIWRTTEASMRALRI